MTQQWSPADYQRNASFVPELGASILERLAPQRGERILDLGCGDGVLTMKLVAAGAAVVGVDASPAMIAAASARGLDARVMDARALTFEAEFDAVFSNAALHWIPEADAVARGVRRALRPGGRFVVEFGGHTNVAAIATAIRAVLTRRAIPFAWPWYYPAADEYRAVLEAEGFRVDEVRLFPRPTPLPSGMAAWLHTFGGALLAHVPADASAEVHAEIVDLLAPALRDGAGNWTADYVRLQAVAYRT